MATRTLEQLSAMCLKMEDMCSDLRLEMEDVDEIEAEIQQLTMDIQMRLDIENGLDPETGGATEDKPKMSRFSGHRERGIYNG